MNAPNFFLQFYLYILLCDTIFPMTNLWFNPHLLTRLRCTPVTNSFPFGNCIIVWTSLSLFRSRSTFVHILFCLSDGTKNSRDQINIFFSSVSWVTIEILYLSDHSCAIWSFYTYNLKTDYPHYQ